MQRRARPEAGHAEGVLLPAPPALMRMPRGHDDLRLVRLERSVDGVERERGFGTLRFPVDDRAVVVDRSGAVRREEQEQALRKHHLLPACVEERQERRQRGARAETAHEVSSGKRWNSSHLHSVALTWRKASLLTMLTMSSRTLRPDVSNPWRIDFKLQASLTASMRPSAKRNHWLARQSAATRLLRELLRRARGRRRRAQQAPPARR